METELFSIFSEKQIQAIKDCIQHGMWGNADRIFGNDDKCVTEWGYCTSDISKGGHYKSKEISGICSGIAKTIKENNLNWIFNEADYWDDGTRGMCQNCRIPFFMRKAPTFSSQGFVIS